MLDHLNNEKKNFQYLTESSLSQLKAFSSGPLPAGTAEETGSHPTATSFQGVPENDEVPASLLFSRLNKPISVASSLSAENMLGRGPPGWGPASCARPRSPLPAVLQPALAAPLRYVQQLLLDLPQIREVATTRRHRHHHSGRRHHASPANHNPALRSGQSQPRTLRAGPPLHPITAPSASPTNHSPVHCAPCPRTDRLSG